jgi:hypothetical protein
VGGRGEEGTIIWEISTQQTKKTRGMSHCDLAIYIKTYLKAKEEYLKISNILPCKNIIFKKSSKKNQNPPRYYNSISQVSTQPKYHLSKILI